MMVMMLQLLAYIQMYCISRLTEPMQGRQKLESYSFSYDAELDGLVSLAGMAWVEMTACMRSN